MADNNDASSSKAIMTRMLTEDDAVTVEQRFEKLSGNIERTSEKDPRKIARKYQLELCEKALRENVIVYLGTGCGKTHIAVLVMYELRHLIKKPQKDICVFLAPTVALVQQQANVIEESTDFKVGIYCGDTKPLKRHHIWEKELEEYEVFVMTPDKFLHSLYHCFIRMDSVALLIFDECHHAQLDRSHPYADIMKIFYKTDAVKVPRIFGMTASPVVGKVASCEANLSKSLNSLEEVLHSKVYSVENTKEMDNFVASPAFNIYYYGPVTIQTCYKTFCDKLMEVKRQCLLTLKNKENDPKTIRGTSKMLNRIHNNTMFCLENLGIWGALQAVKILWSGNHFEGDEKVDAVERSSDDDSICNTYLAQAVEVFAANSAKVGLAYDLTCPELIGESFLSKKLKCLVEILLGFRVQPGMKCIIFVKRIITARALSSILNNIKSLASWKCDFLLGVHSGATKISRNTMNVKLEKFRSGELNLLIATKVGEEGLDIQTCCLVIRFDLPETVASFIQSRGRARMPQSEYAFLVDRGNQVEMDLIEKFREEENRMNLEISARTSTETVSCSEETTYKVISSGASISSRYSVSLLHNYCTRLPHDEFFIPKPEFYYFDDGGTVCHIIMPSNASIHQVVSAPNQSREGAKRDACLKAIKELHKLGALSDYLLPEHDYANEQEEVSPSADSDSSEDEDSGGELHAMYVPTTLKNSFNDLENLVHLNSYHINLSPVPSDRTYRDFCLLVKNPLPAEAEKMKLELHLAQGRSVMTGLVPLGTVAFDRDEFECAKKYQELFFKVLLDRSELAEESVFLGSDYCWSRPLTFYLILPIILRNNRNTVTVDWKIVHRCLSSPTFRTPSDKIEDNSPHENELLFANNCVTNNAKVEGRSPADDELLLANGCIPKRDVIQSLVYVPHKKVFYFVNSIDYGKNGRKLFDDLTSSSDEEISSATLQLKLPNQPLLELKPLQSLHNLLHNRHEHNIGPRKLEEFFIHLPPELCILKILGFSKDFGSTISLLPSIMHRLENLLVAVDLKDRLSSSFPEAAELSVIRILEAITTERCQERFSLERLETLGDSFLKFAVGRHLFLRHKALDEGELTRIRSGLVNNNNLRRLAVEKKLQVYIRDQPLDPDHFFAPGRPCQKICNEETQKVIHNLVDNDTENLGNGSVIRCSRGHLWLRNKIIADMVEALVGAFLVDSGFKAAVAFLRWIGMSIDFEEFEVKSVLMASSKYMPLSARIDIAALETVLNYQFHCKGLLLQAFIHPSYNKHGGGCYQRLEFLGDAVFDFLITCYLYSAYPKLKPGQLTDLRSASVNNKAFADVAVRKSLYKFMLCDSSALSDAIKKYVDYETLASKTASDKLSENASIKGPPMCPKVLGDLVESCTGAILLDTGFDLNSVWRVVLSLVDPVMSLSSLQISPLRELRELCQSLNWEPPKFSPCKKGRTFIVKAEVFGKDIYKTTTVHHQNKKEATRIAARKLLAILKAEGYASKSKSLQDVLNCSCKVEPKLIGFDETPLSTSGLIRSSNVHLQETSVSRVEDEAQCRKQDGNISAICIPSHNACSQVPSSVKITAKDHGRNRKLRPIDESKNKTARSLLYEVCARQYWKIPLFECCEEDGPDHLKSFRYKVTIDVEDVKTTLLVCSGEARPTKKAAAESAAEAAVWYLKCSGLLF